MDREKSLSSIIIADEGMIAEFGGRAKPTREHSLGYILPELSPNQIDQICEYLNAKRDGLHAEPITQGHQAGILITSDTKPKEHMAAQLLECIQKTLKGKPLHPQEAPAP